ncbi:MAG: peptidoglycan-binding domain-containing protein, partial [Pseudomonadota bacterium]
MFNFEWKPVLTCFLLSAGLIGVALPAHSQGSSGLNNFAVGAGSAIGSAIANPAVRNEVNRRNSAARLNPNLVGSASQRAMVRQLQEDLNTLGYNAGSEDGVYGRRSQAAVQALFGDAGMSPPSDIASISGWVRRAIEQTESQTSRAPAAVVYLRGLSEGYVAARREQQQKEAARLQQANSVNAAASSRSVAPAAAARPAQTAAPAAVAVAAARPSTSAAAPTRQFAGPDEYPPTGFRGYGVIAFKSLATEFDRLRHNIICEAYIAALIPNAQQKSRNIDKFVTIWPVSSSEKSLKLNNTPVARRGEICPDAITEYNAQLADGAIRAARLAGFKDTGRGPFFLGWLPSDKYGQSDALIIVMDMSLVQTYTQAEALIAEWKLDIQTDPALLNNPYAPEMVRRKLRRWSDKYGHGFLTFI